jgi:peptidoglycan/LPS O-acetylase OafA/YrhL
MEKKLPVSKPHYLVLDGLRGVAAMLVVAFHICEAHATSRFDQVINHGYLAVDFFFVLSGFVVGYAYDDRWQNMSIGSFLRKRLTRLQPMVIIGMIIGAICFYFQDSVLWPGIHLVPLWKMLMVMLIGFTLVPVPASLDIRGWSEMHPLNGPGWSLFFEYIANILYGLWIRKFSKGALAILVIISACALIQLAVSSPNGDVIGGWSLEPRQLRIGFTRVMYPFFAGLLLSRMAKPKSIKHGFLICSLLTIAVLAMPRVGTAANVWTNGLYDSLVIIIIFPLIVFLGASSRVTGEVGNKVCKFFGDISYPIYITHYPLIYIYTGWVADHKIPIGGVFRFGPIVFAASIASAYLCLKLYDEPVRQWLGKKRNYTKVKLEISTNKTCV